MTKDVLPPTHTEPASGWRVVLSGTWAALSAFAWQLRNARCQQKRATDVRRDERMAEELREAKEDGIHFPPM